MELKVLVIDDDKTSSWFVEKYLSMNKFSTFVANDVNSAFEFLENNDFDIVITDKNMPGTNNNDNEGGMEILRHVRGNFPGTQVIMVTGFASIETAIEALKLGAFEYLVKPVKVDELKKAIDRILEYKAFLNPENTLDIYKAFHDEILDLLKSSKFSDSAQHKILRSLDEKMDLFFKSQRNWESVVMQQREALAQISMYAEKLMEQSGKDSPLIELAKKIYEQSMLRV